jgi:hypothetical protein
MKATYQVKVFQEDSCNYFIAMQTKDKDLAVSKMNRLNKEGHTAHINVIDVELPDHLKDLSKDKIKGLQHIFKRRD